MFLACLDAILLLVLFFTRNYLFDNLFLILVNLQFIPQIYYIAKKGQQLTFDTNLNLCVLLPRSLLLVSSAAAPV